MNRPSLVTRLIASRFMALVLLLACGAVIVEWLTGGASWWQGMLALLMAMQTLSAVGKVSRLSGGRRNGRRWPSLPLRLSALPIIRVGTTVSRSVPQRLRRHSAAGGSGSSSRCCWRSPSRSMSGKTSTGLPRRWHACGWRYAFISASGSCGASRDAA